MTFPVFRVSQTRLAKVSMTRESVLFDALLISAAILFLTSSLGGSVCLTEASVTTKRANRQPAGICTGTSLYSNHF